MVGKSDKRTFAKEIVDKVQKPGLKIFRVEQFDLRDTDPKNYGCFFHGDCYLVVKTEKRGGCCTYNVHYWIGRDSTQDEYGAIAMYSVVVDDALGGSPIQYRECDQHESNAFKKYFKSITYLEGGTACGFRMEIKPRQSMFYRVNCIGGKARFEGLRDMSVEQLNSNHMFVLDTYDPEEVIYIWRGAKTRIHDVYMTQCGVDSTIATVHGGDAAIEKCREGVSLAALKAFYTALGYTGDPENVKPSQDDDTEIEDDLPLELWRVKMEDGSSGKPTKVYSKEEDGGFPTRDMLDTTDAYILTNKDMIFIWKGTFSSDEERVEATKAGEKFAKEKNSKATLVEVICNSENIEFTSLFNNWYAPVSRWVNQPSGNQPSGIAKPNPLAPITVSKSKKEPLVFEKKAGGKLKMFRVICVDEDNDYSEEDCLNLRVESPVDEDGSFSTLYSEEGYLFFYEDSRTLAVIFWIGEDISAVDKGRCAAAAKKLDDDYQGMAIQIRERQGREDDNMMQFFRIDDCSKLVIRKGKDPHSKHYNPNERDNSQLMLQIRGEDKAQTVGFEVDYRMGNLHSNDCFIVANKNKKSLWFGKNCSGDERQMCESLFKLLFPHEDKETIYEDTPRDLEWKKETFGANQEEYKRERKIEALVVYPEPKLYQLTNATGKFKLYDLGSGFTQYNLVPDDVMLLFNDTYCFIWIGSHSRPEEAEKANEQADEMVFGTNVKSIHVVKQGHESMSFKSHFGVWNPKLWQDVEGSDDCDCMEGETRAVGSSKGSGGSKKGGGGGPKKVYAYEILISTDCPEECKECKEEHLSDEQFKETFKMSKEEFRNLKGWQQAQRKKEAGLF